MNRHSEDSLNGRYFGFVPNPSVIGKALPVWTRRSNRDRPYSRICHSSVRSNAAPFLRSLIAAHHASPFFPILSTPKDASSFRRTDGEQKFVWPREVKPEAAEGGGATRQA